MDSNVGLVEKLLDDIIHRENITNAKITRENAYVRGDGYMGDKEAITITGDDNKTLNLFVKMAQTSEKMRSSMPVNEMFLREIYFYDNIYPAFEKFQRERYVENPFNNVVKCYGTISEGPQEMLLFDNLKLKGYNVWPKRMQMNEAHCRTVFEMYGKLHAVSYAMKAQEKDLYQELCRNIEEDMVALFIPLMEGYDDMAREVCQCFDGVEDVKLLKRFNEFCDEMMSLIERMSTEVDEYSVIVHGDCWCNNMMFKYNDINDRISPSETVLIDFQVVRHCSPVLDLSYFLYACCPPEIYSDLDYYLHVYHDSLTAHLLAMGCNRAQADKLLPFEVLRTQWRKYSRFGLSMAVLVLKMVLLEGDENIDMTEEFESGRGFLSKFREESKGDEVYRERLSNVVRHMYENGFL